MLWVCSFLVLLVSVLNREDCKMNRYDVLTIGTVLLAIYADPALRLGSPSMWLIGFALLFAHLAGKERGK